MKKVFIYICSALLLSSGVFAQDFKMPAASPSAKVSQQFSISNIDIEYSRPSKKGRTIFGDLVPYNKIWRTGANANTKITFGEDVIFGGQRIPAGTYSLYTIPARDKWTVILNKGLENWGLTGYNHDEDIAKVDVKPVTLNTPLETFTIDLGDFSGNDANLNIMWDNVKVAVKITADNKEQILAHLEKELKGSKPPYQQAANYYLEQNYKLDEALVYADKAIETNKEAFWLHWMKAKIYAKMGKKTEAIASAQKAADLSKGSDYEQEYSNNLQKLKKELQ